MENWWSLFTIIGDNQRNPLGIYEKAGAVQYKWFGMEEKFQVHKICRCLGHLKWKLTVKFCRKSYDPKYLGKECK